MGGHSGLTPLPVGASTAAREAQYAEVSARISALLEGESDWVAAQATVACELRHAFEYYNWVGFYRAVGARELVIGPYQGGHGCLRIAFSRGVCGAAARSRETQLVPDVHAFPGHIACASSTRSELVVPLVRPTADGRGTLLGVLDVDSDAAAAFTAADASHLEALAAALAAREWLTGVDAASE